MPISFTTSTSYLGAKWRFGRAGATEQAFRFLNIRSGAARGSGIGY